LIERRVENASEPVVYFSIIGSFFRNFGGSPVFVVACVVEALADLLLRGWALVAE
jgi:hypothetical protein